MRRKLTWFVLLSAAVVVTGVFHAERVWATAANGFAATTLAKGTLGKFEV
jgi:hypothetical protein